MTDEKINDEAATPDDGTEADAAMVDGDEAAAEQPAPEATTAPAGETVQPVRQEQERSGPIGA